MVRLTLIELDFRTVCWLLTFGAKWSVNTTGSMVGKVGHRWVKLNIYSEDMPVEHLLQESLRLSRMTRFYIKQKEDPHGPHIAIYVSCLPTSLSQRQYEHILLDMIGRGLSLLLETDLDLCDVIF